MSIKRALKAFAEVYGLQAGQVKTTIYFGNVDEGIQQKKIAP